MNCEENCCCHQECNILDKIEHKIRETIPEYVYKFGDFKIMNLGGIREIAGWTLSIPIPDIEECDKIVLPKKKVISLEALNERIERLEKLNLL